MYKDADRRRQAVREATRRYRARLKGITVIPDSCDTQDVIPCENAANRLSQDLTNRDYRGIAMDYQKPKSQSVNPMLVGYVPPRK